jgi:Flp pilus assembly protein TadD
MNDLPEQDEFKAAEDAEDRAARVHQLVAEGARLLSVRRPGEAVTRLSEARRLDPYNVPAAINLGGAYIMQGKFRLAVPVLEAAAQLEPDNVMVWTNLAAAYLGKLPLATEEHQNQAIRAYERALDLDPQVPHVHYNLGLIYLERKDFHHAAAHFYRAVEVDPGDRDAQHYLDKLQHGDL